ncbi:MAG: single-stranded DNA-binding protein [Bacilli bacterium]|nr:single-stranded DNA-binding protein [Bacilli bacterium]
MVNSVVLVGRLVRDPELRKTSSGNSVASFTIASDDSRRGPNGEKQTVFMACSLFGKGADNLVKFCKKGNLVGVVGRLTQRKYNRKADNSEVTVTEIMADRVDFLEPKSNAGDPSGYVPDDNVETSLNQAQVASDTNLDSIDIIDDDLPF